MYEAAHAAVRWPVRKRSDRQLTLRVLRALLLRRHMLQRLVRESGDRHRQLRRVRSPVHGTTDLLQWRVRRPGKRSPELRQLRAGVYPAEAMQQSNVCLPFALDGLQRDLQGPHEGPFELRFVWQRVLGWKGLRERHMYVPPAAAGLVWQVRQPEE